MATKNRKIRKNKDTEKGSTPFSRLDVYKELQTINERVSNVNLLNVYAMISSYCIN